MSDMNSSNTLSVAVAQPMVIPGDVQGNLARMKPLVLQASERGSKLILFSENALNGYDHHGVGAATALTLNDPAIVQLQKLAAQTNQTIVAGFFEKDHGKIYNSAAIAMRDGSLLVQRKHAVTPLEVSTGNIQAGPRTRTMFQVEGWNCAVLICADSGIPDIYQELAATGCDIVIGPTAGLGSDEKIFHQAELKNPQRLAEYIKAAQSVCFISPEMSLQHDMALICCNQMGYSAKHRYFHPGHACIMDWTGEIRALIPGRFVAEHLRPDMAVGFITRRRSTN